MKLVTLPAFWVVTTIFALAVLFAAVFVLPATLREFNDQKTQLSAEQVKADESKRYQTIVSQIAKESATVDELYELAKKALPESAESELLLLELEVLMSQVGMSNTNINVPLNQATQSQAAAGGSVIAPQGALSTTESAPAPTQPVVKSAGDTTFTVSGEGSWEMVVTLIEKLRTFSRWNKVTAIELSKKDSVITASISAQAYTRPTSTKFIGSDPELLTKAKELFFNIQSYTTRPDPTTEGTFGKTNPFN